MFCKIGVLQLAQRTSKSLYKNSILLKMKDGLVMNSSIGISFLKKSFVDDCLSLTINTPRQYNWLFWSLVSTNENYKFPLSENNIVRTNQASAIELLCENI